MQVIFSLNQEQLTRAQQQVAHAEELFGDNGRTIEENAANGVLYCGNLMGFHHSTHENSYLSLDPTARTMSYEGAEEAFHYFQETINLILG